MLSLLTQVFEFVGLVVLFYMTVCFALALIFKRNDIADIAWGFGFIVVAVLVFSFLPQLDRGFWVTLMVAIWGSRLSYHILKRNIKKPEDARYATWRNEWGRWFIIRSYIQIFLLQGLLLILIVSPVIIINTFRGGSITPFDIVGGLVWIIGFAFESTGDRQLKDFIKNPENKGKLMNKGLWNYTRHPNYFGEVTQWWGLWIIALSVPYGFFGIIGPLTISFLILKVSGIPMLEKSFAGRPDFEEYKKKTNAFFPWFPKK